MINLKISIIAFSLIVLPFFSKAQGSVNHNITANDMKTDFFIESESKFNFEQTVENFKNIAENKTWKITAIHDLQQTMKTHGKDVLPVKVFAICHPKHSSKILEKDDERIISSMMPCRLSIYNKSDGKTYMSRMNSIIMAQLFEGVIKEVMTDAGMELEEMIKELNK